MQNGIYDRSVASRQVQLIGYWQYFSYYLFAFLLFFMPVTILLAHLAFYLYDKSTAFQEGELWGIIITLILSVITYVIKRRNLKFRVIQTKLNHLQLKEILIQVARQLKWTFVSSTDNVFVAKTNPGFFSGSLGEQIIVLFYQDSVFVNSISDPDKRPAMGSWFRNSENEETLIDKIRAGNQNLDRSVN
jgi:hypothetical protein